MQYNIYYEICLYQSFKRMLIEFIMTRKNEKYYQYTNEVLL